MKILITGASGFIGRHLTAALARQRHEVLRLGLDEPDPQDPRQFRWDPARNEVDERCLRGVDAVFHLAGESIAGSRWNDAVKRRIVESRVQGSRVLIDAIARQAQKPKALIAASAIGIYGDRGAEDLDEGSAPGGDFLAQTCAAWESETRRAADLGLRLAQARMGVVLGRDGGALQKMLLPFKLGVGGPLGNGRQFMSWITIDDEVRALLFLLEHEECGGVYNLTAPNPVSNAQFSASLGRALSRPAFLPMPAFAVKALFGEMGEALLLGGQKALPNRLKAAGFRWDSAYIGEGLSKVLAS